MNAHNACTHRYPIAESFRLSMYAMSHPDFPFNVLGSVLARNKTEATRPIGADEALVYRCVILSSCSCALRVFCALGPRSVSQNGAAPKPLEHFGKQCQP